MDYLSEVIEHRGWGTRNIGVEMDNYYFSARCYAQLQAHLPNAKFHDATALVNWQRAVKSETEIFYMRRRPASSKTCMNAFSKSSNRA